MKKSILTISALAALTLNIVSAQTITQSKGTIPIRGELTTASCSLEPVVAINMGSVTANSFNSAGKTGGWGETMINFKDCNLGVTGEESDLKRTAVKLTIPQGTAAGSTPYWANTLGTAKNVGVELEVNNQPVTANKGLDSLETPITASNSASYHVKARMVATGVASEGTIETAVPFIAEYK